MLEKPERSDFWVDRSASEGPLHSSAAEPRPLTHPCQASSKSTPNPFPASLPTGPCSAAVPTGTAEKWPLINMATFTTPFFFAKS